MKALVQEEYGSLDAVLSLSEGRSMPLFGTASKGQNASGLCGVEKDTVTSLAVR